MVSWRSARWQVMCDKNNWPVRQRLSMENDWKSHHTKYTSDYLYCREKTLRKSETFSIKLLFHAVKQESFGKWKKKGGLSGIKPCTEFSNFKKQSFLLNCTPKQCWHAENTTDNYHSSNKTSHIEANNYIWC